MKFFDFISGILLTIALFLSFQVYSQTVFTLMPYPKTAFEKAGNITLSAAAKIIIPSNADSAVNHSAVILQELIKKTTGYNFIIIKDNAWNKSDQPIILGTQNSSAMIDSQLKKVMPDGENLTSQGGYILDISSNVILISGYDDEGVFNGVSTLIQLFQKKGSLFVANCAHIWDFPDYPVRWVFNTQNLRGPSAIFNLQKILDTMTYRKINGIYQSDFKYDLLDQQPIWYFDSLNKFKNLSILRNIRVIPATANIGYSSGYLYRDPNLAEGIPTTAAYFMANDTGRLIPDSRVALPNGQFENVDVSQNFTGWSFYDNTYLSQDKTTFHSGTASAKGTNFNGGNCRFSRTMNCQPFRAYVLSAWVKTQNFTGDMVQLLAIGTNGANNRTLTYTSLSIPATTNWVKIQVIFNTINFNQVILYVGAWGAHSGTIWFDDFQVFDLGLTDILRRSGTPITVKNKTTGIIYKEGIDFYPLTDNIMLANLGNYGPYHNPPAFVRKSTGAIANGDSLIITSYHPFTAVSDNNGNGSVMVCVSEDSLYKIITDQTKRLNQLYNPSYFFMGHDEIRNMNWDKSCLDRGMTPAGLLGDNITKCYNIIKKEKPGSGVFMWSDMVDSFHNATNNYYLVNGDLRHDWDSIPDSIIIVNWNSGKMNQSMPWFAGKGFRQISSVYFDTKSTSNMLNWRLRQENTKGILGTMYTTWANDYSYLTPFSYYAWGAGPAIFHQPVDSAYYASYDTLKFIAKVFQDPYDATDSIVYCKLVVEYKVGTSTKIDTFQMISKGNKTWETDLTKFTSDDFKYRIIAMNKQTLIRQTPQYIVNTGLITNIPQQNPDVNDVFIYPNPANTNLSISFNLTGKSDILINLFDLAGNNVMNISNGKMDEGQHSINCNISGLSKGMYIIKYQTYKTERNFSIIIK